MLLLLLSVGVTLSGPDSINCDAGPPLGDTQPDQIMRGGGVLNKELINNVNWGKPGHGGFRFRFCYQRANFPPQLSLSPKLGNLLKCKS